MAYEEIVFHQMGTETMPQTIYSASHEVGGYTSLVGLLTVNAIAGTTPTVTVMIETSMDGRVWSSAAALTPAGGPGNTLFAVVVAQAHNLQRFVRAKQDLAGAGVQATYDIRAIARD